MTEATTPNQGAADWKSIALELAKRVNFAMTNCSCKGGLLNLETGKVTGWRDYMIEAVEMIPGVSVDREIVGTLDLPMAKRRKAQAEIRKRREEAGDSKM